MLRSIGKQSGYPKANTRRLVFYLANVGHIALLQCVCDMSYSKAVTRGRTDNISRGSQGSKADIIDCLVFVNTISTYSVFLY